MLIRGSGFSIAGMLLLAATSLLQADDWPTYGHDAGRSQSTSENVSLSLVATWTYRPAGTPQPAWGGPKARELGERLELPRNQFDDAFQVAVAAGRVFFGSSADHKLYCLDAADGRVCWTFLTGGPLRLAPCVCEGRVYVGSDDGWVYCLGAETGALVWQFRAAPEDRRVLGSGRMISLWPVRTGVLVDGGIAYFGAGLFPAEGVFLYAVDARTGRELWRNDACGEDPASRISPQGYLLASPTTLYAPLGRVSPAAFARSDGRLLEQTYFGKSIGGSYALLAGDRVFTGTEELVGYRQGAPQDRFALFDGRRLVVAGDFAYVATGSRLRAIARKPYAEASKKAETIRQRSAAYADVLQYLRKERALLLKDISRLSDTLRNASVPAAQPAARVELAEKERALDRWGARYAQEQRNLDTVESQRRSSEGELQQSQPWDVPCTCDQALIRAGETLIAGGSGQVTAYALANGQTRWTTPVVGNARGLAVAEGRLLVSTDRGEIHCFVPSPGGAQDVSPRRKPWVAVRSTPVAPEERKNPGATATAILHHTSIRAGYALVLGCTTGELAIDLARHTDLQIYAVCPNAAKRDAIRRAVDAVGLYGTRIGVDAWPENHVPYADYFADLIVAEDGPLPPAAEIVRMLKPCGGTLLLDRNGDPADRRALQTLLDQTKLAGAIRDDQGTWLKIVRGPLPGAGEWTHLYGNPGNTGCGDDRLVHAPFGVLWFGSPGPGAMVNRHNRSVGPLCADGRLICEGENTLLAYDAYNGRKLWQRDIPGAMRTGVARDCGNLALDHDALFAAIGDHCLRLDSASGATLATFALPGETATVPIVDPAKMRLSPSAAPIPQPADRWAYVGRSQEFLIGSRAAEDGFSSDLFALDAQAGTHVWTYRGQRISNTSIALGEGLAVFVETDASAVVALDLHTGKPRWRTPLDLSSWQGGALGTILAAGRVVVFGVFTDGHDWQRFFVGQFAGRRVCVLDAADGRVAWSLAVGYRVRPLVIGDTLHAEPWAFELRTGEPRLRVNPVTGQREPWQFVRPGSHCGCPTASSTCLFFRSGCLGYYDLAADTGTQHFGGQRPGCWINFIPAAGLLLVPEASAGCLCAYPNQCTVAFAPTAQPHGFGYYSASGPMLPVERLAIHFGAPGDRRDTQGRLWLGWPRVEGPLALPLKLDVTLAPGGAYVAQNSTYRAVQGTDDPWLFTAAAVGLKRLAIPLAGPEDGSARYRVRLLLCEPDDVPPGQRVFDVRLQGRLAAEGVDVVREAGGPHRALIREFAGVDAREQLVVEFIPRAAAPLSQRQMPILQAIEIEREAVTSLGCRLPEFEINQRQRRQSGAIRWTNLGRQPFRGRVEIAAPAGFRVTASRLEIEIPAASHQDFEIAVEAQESAAPGTYAVGVRLLRSDGSVEQEQSVVVVHRGRKARLVIPACEDAFVIRRYPDLNKGDATLLEVDGGDNEVGDIGLELAYVKFRLDIPGQVTSARLRLVNAGNGTHDAGRVRLVETAWAENRITYANRPPLGRDVARLAAVAPGAVVECPLDADLNGRRELSLALDPTSYDGVDYVSREGGHPPELIVEYELK